MHKWVVPKRIARRFEVLQRPHHSKEEKETFRECAKCPCIRRESVHRKEYIYHLESMPEAASPAMKDNLRHLRHGWSNYCGGAPPCIPNADPRNEYEESIKTKVAWLRSLPVSDHTEEVIQILEDSVILMYGEK